MRTWVRNKGAVIEEWIRQKRMKAVDPVHLIFLIWSSTQHYADFEPQVTAVTGNPSDLMAKAEETLTQLFVEGLRPR